MSIASCPFCCLRIHRLCISSENQQAIYIYIWIWFEREDNFGQYYKLSVCYQCKKPNKKQKNKNSTKGEKNFKVSHLQGIFSTTYNLKNQNEYGSYSTCIKKQTTCQILGAKALNMVPVFLITVNNFFKLNLLLKSNVTQLYL